MRKFTTFLSRSTCSWRLCLGLLFLGSFSAQASSLTYFLTEDGCSGTCGISPYGSITLTDAGFNSVTVTEVLKAGEGFVRTGAGNALAFNLDTEVTISNLSVGFSAGTSLATASTFGTFSNFIACTGCGKGASAPIYTPLSFTVTALSGELSIYDFIGNERGYAFASDILGTNRKTGNVAALAQVNERIAVTAVLDASPTPEPASVIFVLSGLALIGLQTLRAKFPQLKLQPAKKQHHNSYTGR